MFIVPSSFVLSKLVINTILHLVSPSVLIPVCPITISVFALMVRVLVDSAALVLPISIGEKSPNKTPGRLVVVAVMFTSPPFGNLRPLLIVTLPP